MQILKPGRIPNTKKKFNCGYCGCIFICDKEECKYHLDQKDGDYLEAICPTCKRSVFVSIK